MRYQIIKKVFWHHTITLWFWSEERKFATRLRREYVDQLANSSVYVTAYPQLTKLIWQKVVKQTIVIYILSVKEKECEHSRHSHSLLEAIWWSALRHDWHFVTCSECCCWHAVECSMFVFSENLRVEWCVRCRPSRGWLQWPVSRLVCPRRFSRKEKASWEIMCPKLIL